MRALGFAIGVSCVACGAASEGAQGPATETNSSAAVGAKAPADEVVCNASLRARGSNVRRVIIRGTTSREVCASIRTMAGRPEGDAPIEADVRALFGTGRFDDVAVNEEEAVVDPPSGADGAREKAVDIVFVVKERARISKVDVTGVNDPAVLKRIEELPEPAVWLDPSWIHIRASWLTFALEEEGFRHAKVSFDVTPPKNGTSAVHFAVTEGPRVTVGALKFPGLKVAKEEMFRERLALAPGQIAPRDAIEHDAFVVSAALYDVGLIDCRVRPDVTESADKKTVDVVFNVEEGPVYKLGSISITGEGKLADGAYASILKELKKGAPFSRIKLLQAQDAIRALHEKKGVPRAIEPETNVDPKTRTIDLKLWLVAP
ncbi:MAG: hypothetical protein HOW73_21135 [Polyangiaceae bacterium]|nr:hypothetical protein [Polyangiaceae bacterium]